MSVTQDIETNKQFIQWNLLTSPFIHVIDEQTGIVEKVSLMQVLTADENGNARKYTPCHPHADLGYAQVQAAVSIVQTVFAPDSIDELKGRIDTPMDKDEFMGKAEKYTLFFNLRESENPQTFPFAVETSRGTVVEQVTEAPFMQGLFHGKTVKAVTGIQKLLPGYPDENSVGGGEGSGCLYLPRDGIKRMCPSCVSAALFLNMSSPSFGGGFKVGLTGQNPLLSMVYHEDLRTMIWLNIIEKESEAYPREDESNISNFFPTWTHPFESSIKSKNPSGDEKEKKKQAKITKVYNPIIRPSGFGMFRGLFYQPNCILVNWTETYEPYVCECCGIEEHGGLYSESFYKQQAYFDYVPRYWFAHPHVPFLFTKEAKNNAGENTPENTDSEPDTNVSDTEETQVSTKGSPDEHRVQETRQESGIDKGKEEKNYTEVSIEEFGNLFPVNAQKTAPSWALLSDLFPVEGKASAAVNHFIENRFSLLEGDDEGNLPVMSLSIGGYANKSSKILSRRHEIVSFTAGTPGDVSLARDIVRFALKVRDAAQGGCKKFNELSKKKSDGLGDMVNIKFFAESESIVLKAIDMAAENTYRNIPMDDMWEWLARELERIGRDVMDSIIGKYINSRFPNIAVARNQYRSSFIKLRRDWKKEREEMGKGTEETVAVPAENTEGGAK